MRTLLAIVIASLGFGAAAVARAQDQPTRVVVEQAPPPNAPLRLERPERTAKNALYVEFAGNGVLYSLNYERFLGDSMSLRAGLGFFSLRGDGNDANTHVSALWMPILFNVFVGGLDHKLELGAGVLPIYATGSTDTLEANSKGSGFALAGTATVAYRYAPHNAGFSWKIGFTPLFGDFGFFPWFGVGFGLTL